jgi:4'-phosphopantetheinyl transferase
MIIDLRGSEELPVLEKLLKKSSTVLLLWTDRQPKNLQAADFLSSSEITRFSQLSFPERKNQFLTSRYYCKNLLASFLKIQPTALDFSVHGEGKLKLPDRFASSGLDFNYSHTRGLFFLGVSNSHDIGVDVETEQQGRNELQVAERIFSPTEQSWIGSSLDRFYKLWSLKEAVVKTVGGGVFRHAQQIEFTVQGDELILSQIPISFGAIRHWQTHCHFFESARCAWALKERTLDRKT